MWTQDFARVLQGAAKVAEQLARAQGPEVAARGSQLTRHATELARLAPYFLQGDGAPAPPEKAPVLKEQVATTETPKPVQKKVETKPLKTIEKIEKKIEEMEKEKKVEKKVEKKMPEPQVLEEPPRRVWEEKHVPSSPLSRILGFGGLAARLAVGTAAEIVRSGGKNGTYNALVSDANAEKLAETLCTMRGAALKLGQMLSIQDEAMIPSKLAVALDRVREK
ncbi:unnamed protein product [Phytophthora lilii]|uniref:Unnamed protein product n=1 Tax=Phytophthora lilii TaxID=2077276 RepID=A0A9W6TH79_9STRA|nr:unnamed protein product [Phytophthora lilii]